VNEIQLIRAQLNTERLHVNAVAQACAAAPGAAQGRALPASAALELRAAATDYLLCVLGWFDARDQHLIELLRTRTGGDEPARHALQRALAQPGSSHEALAPHNNAGALPVTWPAWAQFIQTVWNPRREAIDALMTAITRPADWRTIAGIDADSILDERRRFERVRAACPPGEAC
jgi:hypothetical protein